MISEMSEFTVNVMADYLFYQYLFLYFSKILNIIFSRRYVQITGRELHQILHTYGCLKQETEN